MARLFIEENVMFTVLLLQWDSGLPDRFFNKMALRHTLTFAGLQDAIDECDQWMADDVKRDFRLLSEAGFTIDCAGNGQVWE